MQRLCFIATAVSIISLTAGVALAQAPAGGTAPGAAAGAAAAPAATAAPATTAPAATAPPADKPAAATAEPKKEAAEPKKKKTAQKKMTRQQEIDKSIDSGTVPSRYRSQVPKQYHHLIPFSKQ